MRGKVLQIPIIISLLSILLIGGGMAPNLVVAGGGVKGKVTFYGEPPPAEKFVFESFPNSRFCGKHPETTDEGRRRVINPVETGRGWRIEVSHLCMFKVYGTSSGRTHLRLHKLIFNCVIFFP